MNKKIRILLILIYIGLILLNTKVYAKTGKLLNETTRLRKETSTSSEVVDLISIGEDIEIVSEEGDWYKVNYKNKTGYVRKDMISVEEDSNKTATENTSSNENVTSSNDNTENKTTENSQNTNQETETPVELNQTTEQSASTIQEGYKGKLLSNLDVKILPTINSSVISTINENTEITVTDVINKWCYVETDNISGWVLLSKINDNKASSNSFNQTSSSETEENKKAENENTENETNKEQVKEENKTVTKYVSAETLNLREEPENNSNIITGLKINTQVTVVEQVNSTWSKITVNGKTGYVASKFLSDTKVDVSTRSENQSRTTDTQNTDSNAEKTEQSNNTTSEKLETTSQTTSKNETANTTSLASSYLGSQIVSYAKQFLGNPYVYGGTSLTNGCDCSGFVMSVYSHFGYSLPHSSSSLRSVGVAVDKSNLQAGDIVCFSGHVGIYIGDNKFIHAANETKGIIITSLSDSYYVAKYICARRVI